MSIVWRDFIDASTWASRRNRSRISAMPSACIPSGRISLIAAWRARAVLGGARFDACRGDLAAHAYEVPREHEREPDGDAERTRAGDDARALELARGTEQRARGHDGRDVPVEGDG